MLYWPSSNEGHAVIRAQCGVSHQGHHLSRSQGIDRLAGLMIGTFVLPYIKVKACPWLMSVLSHLPSTVSDQPKHKKSSHNWTAPLCISKPFYSPPSRHVCSPTLRLQTQAPCPWRLARIPIARCLTAQRTLPRGTVLKADTNLLLMPAAQQLPHTLALTRRNLAQLPCLPLWQLQLPAITAAATSPLPTTALLLPVAAARAVQAQAWRRRLLCL